MVASNDLKARLLDLSTSVLRFVQDGKRDAKQVVDVLQLIHDNPNFAAKFFPADTSADSQMWHMVATNDQKARLLDLTTSMLELVRDGKRDTEEVANVLQVIKDRQDFAAKFFPTDVSADSQLRVWQKLYKKHFGLKKDFSKLRIPEKREGFDRLIVVVRKVKISQIIRALQKEMKVWVFTEIENLDKVQDVVSRPEGDYVIWVRDTQEAHEETANKSGEDIQKEGLNTETLKERLLHELAYFLETGKHLDEENRTLCAGSRSRLTGVGVPYVCWDSDYRYLSVYWYHLDHRCSRHMRSRMAIS